MLFVVILFNGGKRHGKQRGVFCGLCVVALDADDIFVVTHGAETEIGAVSDNHRDFGNRNLEEINFRSLSDVGKLAACDNGRGLVQNAYGALDGLAHLMNYSLKKSV